MANQYDVLYGRVRKIINWLKEHGKGDETVRTLDVPKRGAYMEFHAEWQQWPLGCERLFLMFTSKSNGDVMYDPLLLFDLSKTEIKSVLYENSFVGVSTPAAVGFASETTDTIIERHFPDLLVPQLKEEGR